MFVGGASDKAISQNNQVKFLDALKGKTPASNLSNQIFKSSLLLKGPLDTLNMQRVNSTKVRDYSQGYAGEEGSDIKYYDLSTDSAEYSIYVLRQQRFGAMGYIDEDGNTIYAKDGAISLSRVDRAFFQENVFVSAMQTEAVLDAFLATFPMPVKTGHGEVSMWFSESEKKLVISAATANVSYSAEVMFQTHTVRLRKMGADGTVLKESSFDLSHFGEGISDATYPDDERNIPCNLLLRSELWGQMSELSSLVYRLEVDRVSPHYVDPACIQYLRREVDYTNERYLEGGWNPWEHPGYITTQTYFEGLNIFSDTTSPNVRKALVEVQIREMIDFRANLTYLRDTIGLDADERDTTNLVFMCRSANKISFEEFEFVGQKWRLLNNAGLLNLLPGRMELNPNESTLYFGNLKSSATGRSYKLELFLKPSSRSFYEDNIKPATLKASFVYKGKSHSFEIRQDPYENKLTVSEQAYLPFFEDLQNAIKENQHKQ